MRVFLYVRVYEMKNIDSVLDQLTTPQNNELIVDNDQGVVGDTVDALQKGLYDGAAGIADFVGADGIRDWAKENSDDQMHQMSQAGRDAMGKQFFQDDQNGDLEFGEAWGDGRALAMQVAHMMGMNADILVGGGAVKAGRMSVTALGKKIKTKLSRKIKDPALLDQAAKHGTEAYLAKLSGRIDPKKLAASKDIAAKTFDYGLATHAVSSGLGAIDIREEVAAMDYEDLMSSESFKQMARSLKESNPNASPTEILEKARELVGEKAANNIKTNPALMASNFLIGGLGGVALEKLIRGILPAGAGIAAEFGTETIQGGTEQYASNAAKQDVIDPNQSLSEGVIAAGLNEGVAGAGSSATFAAGRKGYEKLTGRGTQENPAPESNEELDMTAGAQEVQPTQPVNPKEAATTKQEKSDWDSYFNQRYTTKSPEIDEVTGEIVSNEVNRPPYIMRRDGQPYTNEQQARNAAAGFNLRDYVPKKVEGGYIMERPQDKPPEMPVKGEQRARLKMQKHIIDQIKARKESGEFLNEKEARQAQQMLKQGATSSEVIAQLDKAFIDPARAAIDKWKDEEERKKADIANARLWHTTNQQAVNKEQRREVKQKRYEETKRIVKQERDDDYTRAELQRSHEQYMEKVLQDAKEIDELESAQRPKVNDIAAAVKRKRKKIKKALASDPQRRERRQLAQLQAETARKVEAVISTYSKPLQDAPGYQPNNVFADAIINVKAVKKAIEKAPDPVKERKLVTTALLEMAAEAERELMGQNDDGDFTPYDRPIGSVKEADLFSDDDGGISLDEIEEATPKTSKNFASTGAQNEAERQEQRKQLEASRNREKQPPQSVEAEQQTPVKEKREPWEMSLAEYTIQKDNEEREGFETSREQLKQDRDNMTDEVAASYVDKHPNMVVSEDGTVKNNYKNKVHKYRNKQAAAKAIIKRRLTGRASPNVDTQLSVKHKSQVEKALAKGKPVPQEVLETYPDLMQQEQTGKQEVSEASSDITVMQEDSPKTNTSNSKPFNVDDKHIYGEEKNGKYYVGGDTYKDKDEIKARGGRWNKDERAWEFDDKANAESYVTSDKDSFRTAEYVRETRKALESGVVDSGVHIKESRKGANVTETEVRGNEVIIGKTTKIGRRTKETEFRFPLDKVKEHLTPDEVKTLEILASENAKNAEQESEAVTIDTAANEAATSPTNDRPEPSEAQIEAGNYKKGHVNVAGFDISIENPKGSTRRGTSEDGKAWESTMQHHYGDIKGTTGADGDPVDVFIGDNPSSENVYVINQVDPKTGKFDEHKIMMGFDSLADAKDAYLSNYEKGWKGLYSAEIAKPEELKSWLESGNTNQPYGKKPAKDEPARDEQLEAKKELRDFFKGKSGGQWPSIVWDAYHRIADKAFTPKEKAEFTDSFVDFGFNADTAEMRKAVDKLQGEIAAAQTKSVSSTTLAPQESEAANTAKNVFQAKFLGKLAKQAGVRNTASNREKINSILREENEAGKADYVLYYGVLDAAGPKFDNDTINTYSDFVSELYDGAAYQMKNLKKEAHSYRNEAVKDIKARDKQQWTEFVENLKQRVENGEGNSVKKPSTGTAPEHVHNEGKPLDESVKYDKTAYGENATEQASYFSDGDSLPLNMSKEDFNEITDQWASVFVDPDKRVITAKKVGDSYITEVEANKRIDDWKKHVDVQHTKGFGENSQYYVLSLFDKTGQWAKPYAEAGYNVLTFDIQDDAEMGDVMNFSIEYFNENWDILNVYAILAACPCTDFASSGARWFKDKDLDGRTEASKELVFQTLRTIEYFKPNIWALENPVGRIERLTGLPKARMTFDPHHFGAPYTKKTILWGNFNADLPTANVEPTEGSKMHSKFGGKSQATKNARSETPEGFAYAFFMANNRIDDSVEKRLTDDFPQVSGAVKKAVEVGMTEDAIREAIESPYWNEDFDIAARDLVEAMEEHIAENGLAESPVKYDNVTATTTGANIDGQTRPRNAASSEGNGEVRGETPKSAEGGSGSNGPASPPSSGAATQGNEARPTNSTERSDQGSDPTSRFKLDDIGDIANGTASQRVAANLAAIRLSKILQQENRPATAKEKATLAQYVGWGGLKRVFDNVGKQAKFEKEAQAELKQLLTPTEFTAVANTVRTAFYTSKDIVKAMWAGVEAFNLTSKTGKINVVEPSVGTGNFIGWQPDSLRDKSNWSATELDPITGTIAQQVYDDATIKVSGFQDAAFKKGVFSLAIGNPPFGSQPLYDKREKDISGLSLHNFMIAKSAKLLHENGLMMMVITNRFLDTKNANHRDLSKMVDFVGAVRLPNTAFKSNAGTEVTTDIVVFRKLKQGETAQNTVWTDVDGAIDGIRINKYFEQNPQNILGTLSSEGTMYAGREGGELTVNPSPEHADINQSVTSALQKMAADYDLAITDETTDKIAGEVMLSESDLALGGFMVNEDGKVLHRFDDTHAGANVQEITPQSVLTDNGQKLVGVKALLDSKATMEDMLAYTREHLLNSKGSPNVKTKPMEAFYDHVGVNGMSKQRAMSKGEVTRIVNEGVEKASLGENNYNKLRDILKIRNTALALVKAEKQDTDNIDALRAQLNREYDKFTVTYGKKNKPVAISESVRILGDDLSLESALDSVSATGEIRKHDIFSRRMIEPYAAPTTASNIDDAVTYSIQNKGKVDVAHIAELMGISKLEAKEKLTAGDNPYLFLEPTTDEYVFIDDYLSGNVKKKYLDAKYAGLDKNVAALKRVLPKDKPANKVKASIRATWIDGDVFERFLEELGYKATVNVSPILGRISLGDFNKGESTELGAQFRHESVGVEKLFEHATSGRSITVYQGSVVKGTREKDEKATKSANLLINKMAELFEQWVGTDATSKEQIAQNFNERVNTHVERRYNGRLYFKPVGVNPLIDLRKTQLDGALRIVQSQNSLLDHTVGAGKTFTQIAAIMERKRLGLSKKPLLAVPNHIIGSFASDFYTLYPGANILVVSEKQINAQNRRKFFSKIATSDYDAIIIGHSHLKNLPNSPLAEEQVIQEKLGELRKAKEEAKREAKEAGGRGASVSQIEEAIDRLNGKLKELKEGAEKRDDKIGLNFEEMGIDFLAIDEAHEFKNLMYSTSSDRVVGMNDPKGSQKAFDLLVKARSVQNLGKQGAVSFMTGTPISNSLVELYTMMYYLGYEDLKENNISHYDAFAGSFLNTENAMEYTATGTLKERVVLKGLNNVKELSTKYRQFADVITNDDMKRIYTEDTEESNRATGENKDTRFPIPNVKGGQRQIDLAEATEQQRLYNDALIARMEAISSINGKEERLAYSRLDNPLKVLTDAKKASLDIRLVDPVSQRDKTGKIMRAADNVKRIYDKWESDKGTQLVFSDMGVPVKSALQNAKKELKAIADIFIPNGAKWADSRLKSLESSETKYGDIASEIRELLEAEQKNGTVDPEDIEKAEEALHKNAGLFVTADVKFSVYDDLRTVLESKGIPAREIEFIHDHDTQAKKSKLFERMRAGDVRVLIGSSFKMGAGTNVQDLLVGLHHLDAPWRPSEMEQREGRIIRQGNKLYERAAEAGKPDDFEVEVIAYATQGSSDPVMWQILERKAAAIEQFRQGNLDEFVEEEQSDSDSYAELKAQTTGNPIYRDKLKADNKVVETETAYKSALIGYSGAKKVVDNYGASKGAYQATVEALKNVDLSAYDADALDNEIVSNIEKYAADVAKHANDLDAYDKLSDKDKKATKKPKLPTKTNILKSKHPYVVMLKSKIIDPIDAALKDGREVTKKWEVSPNVTIEVTTTQAVSIDDKDSSIGMYVDGYLVIGKRKISLVDKRGESAIKSLSNSPKRVNGLLLDNVIESIEYLRSDSQQRLDKLEKDIVLARKGVKNKPDDRAFEQARATSDWLYVEVEIADRLEDIRRSKVANKYIDESDLPISRSSFDPKGLTFRDVTHEGKAYRTLGLTSPTPQGSLYDFAPAYNAKTGESVYLVVSTQRFDDSKEQSEEKIIQVHSAPDGVKKSDFKAIAQQLEKAKQEAEAEAEAKKQEEAGEQGNDLLDAGSGDIIIRSEKTGQAFNKSGVSLSKREVSLYLDKFLNEFKGITLDEVTLTQSPVDIYGQQWADSNPGGEFARGSYNPRRRQLNIFFGNIHSFGELREVLLHELHVHQGLGLYPPKVQEQILNAILQTRGTAKAPALKRIWAEVDELYKNRPQLEKAEEVLAKLAQSEPADRGTLTKALKKAALIAVSFWRKIIAKTGHKMPLTQVEMESMLMTIGTALQQGKQAGQRLNLNSLPSKQDDLFDIPSAIGKPAKAMKQIGQSAVENAKRMKEKGWKAAITDPIDNTRKTWLGAIPRRYLDEFSEGAMPSIKAYMKRAKQMDADRNELMNIPAGVVDTWREYIGQNATEAKELAKLMHMATIASIDPSKSFEALRDNVEFDPRNIMVQNEDLSTGEEITPEYVKKRIKELKELAKSRSGSGTAHIMERIQYLKSKLAQQKNREQSLDGIVEAWEKLSPEGQEIFEKVRDSYNDQHEEYRKALEDRIFDEIQDQQHRKKFMDYIRQLFETQRVEGPYFPLARFGSYFGVVKDANDKVVEFSKFETKDQRRQWAEERQSLLDNGEYIKTGKLPESGTDALKQVDPKYHQEVMMLLDSNNANGRLMDEVNQIYLNRLPASSMRKQFIHRKKTAGYNADAMRAYSHNMFHSAYQLARLRHSHKMQVYLDDMQQEADIAADNDRAMDIYNEMVKRHDWAMNPTSSPWAAKLTSLGFAWYLGVTPAAAFVNTTQTWMVGLPVLGAKYGFTESAKALLKASMDFMKGGFHVDKTLTDPKEKAAFEEFRRRGLIEKTLAHDLAGVSEGGLNYSSTMHKVMTYVSFFFHHAERYNREVTAMAAFRLARKAGEAEPVDVAEELTLDSHFDYSNAERARFMQNDAAKVLLLFRQHSLNMTYRLLRDTNNAMRGESEEVKRLARRQLTGILGMTGLFAGTAGLPFMYFGADVIGSAIFGDEDEPWEFEAEFRNYLADHIGETAAHAVVHGVADVATGATISSRIGLNNLWFREADATLEGRGLVQYYTEQMLGPIAGMAFSAGTAWDIGKKGQLLRGIEYALPKVLKDSLRGLRYIDEGVTNIRGDALVNDTSGLEEFYQIMGFTPTRISETYEQNRAIKGYEKSILYRRQLLINQYATAKRTGDKKYLQGIKRQIDKFNQSQPEVEISRKTLLRSMRTRQRYSEKAQRGIQIDERLQKKLGRLDFVSE